jgi:hypothetical protein
MTTLLAALLLATIATAPATGDADRQRPRPARPARDATARKHPILGADAGAAALDVKSRDIEIIVVGDVEDSDPGRTNLLELGNVSYRPPSGSAGRSAGRGSSPVTILRRMVTVRIGAGRTGFAPLRAFLQADDGRCRIRVDGKTLTAAPQVIDPLAPLGQPVSHVVEIEIATTATEGPVATSISWTSDAQ